MRDRFFPESAPRIVGVHTPTIQRVPVQTESGEVLIETVDVDTIDNSLKCLSYTDFDITRCLKAGIDLKHLNINHSSPLGIDDSVLIDFDQRVESISSELFIERKSELL